MNETTSHLAQIASRAVSLYSRPTVAMELVRLTEEERVDADTIRECIAQDPALACKVLRVVNSSLYGLNRPVADLNQAIGLLGIKPLKLLVLGFSLPDALFAERAARELQWYWTNTLTRAVAARQIAEQIWHLPGDEAFTAGLLQDIGILVLLQELGEPYAKFLSGVVEEKCHLAALEQDTLRFDHMQLSAALLRKWHLPDRLVDSIALPKRPARLVRMSSPDGDLPQILHLAELLVQLVGQHRLQVLADLLEWGKAYRGMTKSMLAALVEGLQPQVDQLAEVLSLELADKRDYVAVLLEAHRQMAALSEQVAYAPAPDADHDRAYSQLLSHTGALSDAMETFLDGGNASRQTTDASPRSESHGDEPGYSDVAGTLGISQFLDTATESSLALKLVTAAKRCRDRRQELSLIIVEPNVYDVHSDPHGRNANSDARRAIVNACTQHGDKSTMLVALSEKRTAAVLSNCERRAALEMAQAAIAELAKYFEPHDEDYGQIDTTLSIGVATASVVPKNFDARQMIDAASRCVSAARACGISTVKSIEV